MDNLNHLIRYLQVIQYDDGLFDKNELDKIIKRIRDYSTLEHPKSLNEPCRVIYDNPPGVPDIDGQGNPVYAFIRCPRCFERFDQDTYHDDRCEYCGQTWRF